MFDLRYGFNFKLHWFNFNEIYLSAYAYAYANAQPPTTQSDSNYCHCHCQCHSHCILPMSKRQNWIIAYTHCGRMALHAWMSVFPWVHQSADGNVKANSTKPTSILFIDCLLVYAKMAIYSSEFCFAKRYGNTEKDLIALMDIW